MFDKRQQELISGKILLKLILFHIIIIYYYYFYTPGSTDPRG